MSGTETIIVPQQTPNLFSF